ncbi:Putative prophage CPS-53 integrase [Delftia tsuruhatensis]|uniref:tyrosine-type recombinase/integrase n=1 Tax=Delftia tsuruhatensis TaxID=180282 RepID=UPI001E6ACCAC|nr:integrase arm-type DNA-binding domain-containing protein [Delftia tsuruhatensis]CAB5669989.1 Putative prophage CPS-53 integrase [Delftia tsuruhatensis]CAC9682918.1 Putative prophage CPS-53 integrase [Delftia tsuruhatensis]
MALTDLIVRQAKTTGKPYTLGDFDGLCLCVSAIGSKVWHFRFSWVGKRDRMTLGGYPALSLREAREMRDQARSLLAKGVNPRVDRKQKNHSVRLAGDNTFRAVFEKWFEHRQQTLDFGRQSTLEQITRTFNNDVFPIVGKLTIYEVTRHLLLEVVGRIEKRGALSVAEKVRTWLGQLFDYAMVAIEGMEKNPATDLHILALPLPPVENNPFLRMAELPEFLRALRKYRGQQVTRLAVRLLLLTGVRTGELRLATPEQFDLERGLWLIPVESLKQRKMLTRKTRRRVTDIPPYIVPLSVQAMEIIQHQFENFKTAQKYLFPGVRCRADRMSENTVNLSLKRMGYAGRLTGHGIRATLSTALNEIGYPRIWVDAQLSHADPNKISASYNHAEYVEQRRVMMQDWADRLDLFEQHEVALASMSLTIHLQGLPIIAGQQTMPQPSLGVQTPIILLAPPEQEVAMASPATQRLPAVAMPSYAEPKVSELQRQHLRVLEVFEDADNLPVADYAKLVGKSRRWINYEIQAGNLLAIHLGNRGQRVPAWQLDSLKRTLVQNALKQLPRSVDAWHLYYALTQGHECFAGRAPIEAVTWDELSHVIEVVCQAAKEQLMGTAVSA